VVQWFRQRGKAKQELEKLKQEFVNLKEGSRDGDLKRRSRSLKNWRRIADLPDTFFPGWREFGDKQIVFPLIADHSANAG